VITEFQLGLSDYEGVLNVVRTAGRLEIPVGFLASSFANSPSSFPLNGLSSTRSTSKVGNNEWLLSLSHSLFPRDRAVPR